MTRHLLQERLRKADDWRQLDEWASMVPPNADWKELLSALGYILERRKHRGWLARADGAPLLVVHPLADPAAFSRLDADGRPPEGTLALDCHAEGVAYGVLASGTRLRLFRSGVIEEPGASAATTSYLELDCADLRHADLPLIGLLAPGSLNSGGLFARLLEQARLFGAQLSTRLDEEIRSHVLPELARGLGDWVSAEQGRELADPVVRREVQHACLTWVFRALFVLYAESAGYLPIDHPGYRANALTILAGEAADHLDDLDPHSTSLWDRFMVLVRTLRTGDTASNVPPYNGDLFSAAELPGAALLESVVIRNAVFGRALAALGRDPETGSGVDYSSLQIAHLGHIYEGLLSLQLTLADADLGLFPRGSGARREFIFAPTGNVDEIFIRRGELFWQSHTGARKAGGVYYTPTQLVEHLVARAVLPSLEEHLAKVRRVAQNDPLVAATMLFEFRVLDPACGSAHFLTAALHRMAERIDRFLAEVPLPGVRDELEALRAAAGIGQQTHIEHADLLHRLVLKRCVYGVDLSPMGAEVARLSLWLAAFVPGLSLAYLGHNIQVGDSLIGVGDPSVVANTGGVFDDLVDGAVARGAAAAAELVRLTDRTPDEVESSRGADIALREATAGIRRLYDAWTAGPLGAPDARALADGNPLGLIQGDVPLPEAAKRIVAEMKPLHWPLAFPEVFAKEPPGFNVVIGNPPWEEVTVEELAFYARYSPRLRGMSPAERDAALDELKVARAELADELRFEQARVARLRAFLGPQGGYASSIGDPDLYKFFCQRYRTLLAEGGRLGVVLPRSTFLAAGSRGFRNWLFGSSTVERLDFLVNRRLWMFETHPQYTVALLAAAATTPDSDHKIEVAGVADSAAAFERQSQSRGIQLVRAAMGAGDVVPLLPSQAAELVLATMRKAGLFPYGGGRWRCFPVAEFHETNDKSLWENQTTGWALWKGESFDQHNPHGAEARWCPPTDAALKKARKPRPGADSMLADELAVATRRAAVAAEIGSVRLAFRDVSRSTDSRTARASLIPPQTFLLNSAPYLAFVDGDHRQRAACCAVMNSLPFDWQARRFVENHLNYFVLELLTVPLLTDAAYDELVTLGTRLSCPDERFNDVTDACGTTVGPLADDKRLQLRARVDALVAHGYGLSLPDIDVVLADFTTEAVSSAHRKALREELEALMTPAAAVSRRSRSND
ncbi:hypothetical protein ACAG26_02905 [Mycobacterium sp. pUA109]|uniref:Eco57I restriction-modification methylase domain-containing protein n=1 Tax=Mycobacterium sp. pUA109 TaxID=3238982 RepID=UPI00351ADB5E